MEPRRRFRFLKELSEGAFGKVYLAEMVTGENFKSVVAIKLLHGKWAGHNEIVQRSRDEARVLGLLHHRNIIRVDDLTSINGQCAIVMEYLDGVDLKTLAGWVRERGQRLPRKVIFEASSQIASALDAAYWSRPLQGGEPLHVIHRDIKPSNVMVTVAGEVKVLDFGTAQARFDHREAQTQALAFGSAAYMAPERLLGDPDAPNGDIFSLGVTVYELLTLDSFGKIHIRPEKFSAKLDRRLGELDLGDCPLDRADTIKDVLRKLLAYDANERPSASQAAEMLDALADLESEGAMRRFCREVVKPCRESIVHPEDPNDPLRGTTLFEDRPGDSSSGGLPRMANQTWVDDPIDPSMSGGLPKAVPPEPAPAPALLPEVASPEPAPAPAPEPPPRPRTGPIDPGATYSGEAPPVRAEAPAPRAEPSPTFRPVASASLGSSPQLGDISVRPVDPGLFTAPTMHIGSRPEPEVARLPEPRPEVARPSAPPAPPVSTATVKPVIAAAAPRPAVPPKPVPAPAARTTEPSGSGGGTALKVVGALFVLLLLGGGAVAALFFSGVLGGGPGGEGQNSTDKGSTAAPSAPPGREVELGAPGEDRGTVTLALQPPGKATVSISMAAQKVRQEWDGTGELVLKNAPAGTYITKVEPQGGAARRTTLEIAGGQSCRYTLDVAKGEEWTKEGCE